MKYVSYIRKALLIEKAAEDVQPYLNMRESSHLFVLSTRDQILICTRFCSLFPILCFSSLLWQRNPTLSALATKKADTSNFNLSLPLSLPHLLTHRHMHTPVVPIWPASNLHREICGTSYLAYTHSFIQNFKFL